MRAATVGWAVLMVAPALVVIALVRLTQWLDRRLEHTEAGDIVAGCEDLCRRSAAGELTDEDLL